MSQTWFVLGFGIALLVISGTAMTVMNNNNVEGYQYPKQSPNIRLQTKPGGEDHTFHNDSIENPIRFADNGNLLLYIPVDANLLQLAGTGLDY